MKEKLGLSRNKVALKSYDPDWEKNFLELKVMLQEILKAHSIAIEHVGSTAVKNLASKPIIDVVVGLSNRNQIKEVRAKLAQYNFIYRGDSRNDGEYLFVLESQPEIRTHHIHVVEKKSTQWKEYILFRKRLIENHELRKEYQALKRKLEKLFKNNRGAYTKGKAEFISRVLREK